MVIVVTHACSFNKDAAISLLVIGIIEKQFMLTLEINNDIVLGGVLKETAAERRERPGGVKVAGGVMKAGRPATQHATIAQQKTQRVQRVE